MSAVTAVRPPLAPASPVLEGRGLSKSFSLKQGRSLFGRRARLHAVDAVDLSLSAGRVTAVVGESGSGKTTVVKLLAKIIRPDAGQVLLDGRPTTAGRTLAYTSQVQMVFQDPFASLNPVHRVGHHLVRPLKIHRIANGSANEAAAGLLRRVALEPANSFMTRFPDELSGGQRQRVAIARALAVQPRVLLADEPVSMLDVSIRLGVLNLLADLRDREQLAILYVTHDIASARYLADTIVVMYAGEVVETASSVDLTDNPSHPYTKMLIAAAPDPGRPARTALASKGAPPNLISPPSGCRFHPRCPYAMEICKRQAPPSFSLATDHTAACWLHKGQSEVMSMG